MIFDDWDGIVLCKFVMWSEGGIYCCKIVFVFFGNWSCDLLVICGVILVNDLMMGMLVVFLDVIYIIFLWIGVVSGLVICLFVFEEVCVVVFFGMGG